jgi:hypothetical protein
MYRILRYMLRDDMPVDTAMNALMRLDLDAFGWAKAEIESAVKDETNAESSILNFPPAWAAIYDAVEYVRYEKEVQLKNRVY